MAKVVDYTIGAQNKANREKELSKKIGNSLRPDNYDELDDYWKSQYDKNPHVYAYDNFVWNKWESATKNKRRRAELYARALDYYNKVAQAWRDEYNSNPSIDAAKKIAAGYNVSLADGSSAPDPASVATPETDIDAGASDNVEPMDVIGNALGAVSDVAGVVGGVFGIYQGFKSLKLQESLNDSTISFNKAQTKLKGIETASAAFEVLQKAGLSRKDIFDENGNLLDQYKSKYPELGEFSDLFSVSPETANRVKSAAVVSTQLDTAGINAGVENMAAGMAAKGFYQDSDIENYLSLYYSDSIRRTSMEHLATISEMEYYDRYYRWMNGNKPYVSLTLDQVAMSKFQRSYTAATQKGRIALENASNAFNAEYFGLRNAATSARKDNANDAYLQSFYEVLDATVEAGSINEENRAKLATVAKHYDLDLAELSYKVDMAANQYYIDSWKNRNEIYLGKHMDNPFVQMLGAGLTINDASGKTIDKYIDRAGNVLGIAGKSKKAPAPNSKSKKNSK
jgi:hypothetical protein